MLRCVTNRGPVRLFRRQQVRWYAIDNKWLEKHLGSLNRIFREVIDDEDISATVVAKWIDRSSWINYVNSFRRRIIKEPIEAFDGSQSEFDHFTQELHTFKTAAEPAEVTSRLKNYIVSLVLPKAEVDLHDIVKAHKTLESQTDLRIPHEWYPATRLMKRNFIYHGGPTNSGKVWRKSLHVYHLTTFSIPLYCFIIFIRPIRPCSVWHKPTPRKAGGYTAGPCACSRWRYTTA